MKLLVLAVTILIGLLSPSVAYASTNAPTEVTAFTNDALSIVTLISTAATVFFLIRGGYIYITSTGKPDALEEAKKTIRNALIGLVVVFAASSIVSFLSGALVGDGSTTSTSNLPITQIESVAPSDGLTQVLIDAVNGFIQNIVESSTKPIVDGIMTFLSTTPSLLENASIVKFWLIMLGITDTLFVLVVALLGLQFMSASTFGFEEIEFKHLLPRIGLAFLGANISLFLADYALKASNALVSGVISATGGLNHAWISNAVTISSITNGTAPFIILIFLLIFLIVAIVLLLMYISRLIVISLGAVLSPFIFLLSAIPKTADFAEMAVKGYFVSVFTIFIHVVTIQLAGTFLSLPEQTNNSLISIAVAIGLLLTLLKIPSFMMQLILFSRSVGAVRHMGSQITNVLSTDSSSNMSYKGTKSAKLPRRSANL
ncbi:MAG: pilin [Patescibacteria group bacterium]